MEEITSKNEQNNLHMFREWAINILAPVMIAIVTWTVMEVIEHKSQLAEIRASRYTAKDAYEDRDKLYQHLDSIKNSINSLERNSPTKEEVDRIRESIKSLSQQIQNRKP